MLGKRYATRLNAFKSLSSNTRDSATGTLPLPVQLRRVAQVRQITDVDLNYPDHVNLYKRDLYKRIEDLGLKINGFAMRYYSDPAYKSGAFANPDKKVREKAIDLTRRGIDAAREANCSLMTLWLGQDGHDYHFQADYSRLWCDVVEAIREVAEHDPECRISIEYKPDEPRSFALLRDMATTLLAIDEASCSNLGVTLDFAHMLYAGEQPAASVALASGKTNIYGVHLNDGHSRRDDGLMVGSVHQIATIEFLYELCRKSYDGVIYFDTFPDVLGLDPVQECVMNCVQTTRLINIAQKLVNNVELENAKRGQNPITILNIISAALTNEDPVDFNKEAGPDFLI